MQECPDVAEQLLQVLDHFSAAPAAPETLYGRLRGILQPFPQLLQDFAAFLTPTQARRCGLVGGALLTPVTMSRTSAPAKSSAGFLLTAPGAAAFPTESAVSTATGAEPGRTLCALLPGGVSVAGKLRLQT